MNCQEIIKEWLKEHGYDGLTAPERECGCWLKDFMTCGDNDVFEFGCEPGYYDKIRYGWFTDKPNGK